MRADEVAPSLIVRAGQDGVVAAERHAQVIGITSVPTFIFDGQYTLSGAQEVGVFAQVLDQVVGIGRGARNCRRERRRTDRPGRAATSSEVPDPPCLLHVDAITPFIGMRRAAAAAGFDLVAVSSFRDFARQLAIWNGKFNGERPMNDADGAPVDGGESVAAGSASRPFCSGRRCPARAGIIGVRMST